MHKNRANIPDINKLVENIRPLATQIQQLARQAEVLYAQEVDAIIKDQDINPQRIERYLEGVLDFCFDEKMLQLFKKLCRHYYTIDPVATSALRKTLGKDKMCYFTPYPAMLLF